MEAQNQKLELIQWLINLNDPNTIKHLVNLKNAKSQRVSLEQYNHELEQAENRINSGDFLTDDDLNKSVEKW